MSLRSIHRYSSTAPRLSGQNCKFLKFLLSFNSQKRIGNKENNTKYRCLTRKPRSHARILIYRTWRIPMIFVCGAENLEGNLKLLSVIATSCILSQGKSCGQALGAMCD